MGSGGSGHAEGTRETESVRPVPSSFDKEAPSCEEQKKDRAYLQGDLCPQGHTSCMVSPNM